MLARLIPAKIRSGGRRPGRILADVQKAAEDIGGMFSRFACLLKGRADWRVAVDQCRRRECAAYGPQCARPVFGAERCGARDGGSIGTGCRASARITTGYDLRDLMIGAERWHYSQPRLRLCAASCFAVGAGNVPLPSPAAAPGFACAGPGSAPCVTGISAFEMIHRQA